ncbi:hypothetical protein CP980_33535 [Streptomyces vinaceus]|uniref:Uncharacterized protein n=1 Tax=Streptomyces vinaceus TaxID=1960 RepID=A0A5J6JI31_STRVI|nr:hypothetical protein [Streptomyces vinaceus]QEV49342.1 hypothetical protein CP980_33535 [Streptomyces vinaceus]GHE44580.1 hypothetical protein GCM10017778_30050 [Streptomyces vinaceus]
MSHVPSRSTGAPTPRAAATRPSPRLTARAVVLALLLALCPVHLALASTADRDALSTEHQSLRTPGDIPLCC